MYAVIRAGGKQYKVAPGDRIAVDLLKKDDGEEISYTPLLVVSGSGEVVTGEGCERWPVTAVVVGNVKDRKIRGFKYKPKVGYRRRWGHRQRYSLIEIRSIGEEVYDPDSSGKTESSEDSKETEEGAGV